MLRCKHVCTSYVWDSKSRGRQPSSTFCPLLPKTLSLTLNDLTYQPGMYATGGDISFMNACSLLHSKNLKRTGVRLIQRREGTGRLHISLFILVYICQRSLGYLRVHLFCWKFVLFLSTTIHDYLFQELRFLIDLGLPEAALTTLIFTNSAAGTVVGRVSIVSVGTLPISCKCTGN